MSERIDVLAVLKRHLLLAQEVASEEQVAEAREVLAAVDELAAAAELCADAFCDYLEAEVVDLDANHYPAVRCLRNALARIAPTELHDKAAELRGRGE